ncbi:MAG: DUF362 domain-containing protein [Deltaproteobacteria bacterium]|nr:MAG: DUF362 domain-containing protein [Deltaproteobacteria bacterium]
MNELSVPANHKVIIRSVPDYQDIDAIRKVVAEGMEDLGTKPFGRVLLKYNMVFAHKRFGRFAYTHPHVLEAIVDVLAARPEVEKVILGERTGVYVPTRYHFSQAGYEYLRGKPKVEVCFFDEDKLVEVVLEKGGFHKRLRFSRTLIEADYKVYTPKLKHHVSTKLTCAMKLNMGICDKKERLRGHDYHLEEKIADLYEVGNPDLVVVDAIDIGQQNEIVPKPLRLGAIMMGTSGVAIDSVGARLLGFETGEIEHLKIARSRGWEPVTDDQIEIKSDVSWDELLEKTRDFDYTYSDLNKIDTRIRFYLGNYPDGDEPCWGGCINMLKGALAVFEAYKQRSLKRAKPVAMVIGEYEGDIDGQGYPVLLIGNCTRVKGNIQGKTRRIRGCPVAIPIFAALAPYYLKIPAPYLEKNPDQMYGFPYHLAVSYFHKFINRVFK